MNKSIRFFLLGVLLLIAGCNRRAEYLVVDGVMLGTNLHLVACSEDPGEEFYRRAMEIDQEMKRSMSIFDEGSLLSR